MPGVEQEVASVLAEDEGYRILAKSVFDTTDAAAIARRVTEATNLCLDTSPNEVLCFDLSVGASLGLRLDDDREVFLKFLIDQPYEAIAAVCSFVNYLGSNGVPCPAVLAEPVQIDRTVVVAYSYLDVGAHRDTADPDLRRAMADMLASLHALSARFDNLSVRTRIPDGDPDFASILPKPHNALFDSSRNKTESRWLDRLATRAIEQILGSRHLDTPTISHLDWSSKHFRFDEQKRIVVIYDWDSVFRTGELRSVGIAAATHLYNWYIPLPTMTPVSGQMRAFVDDYEAATGIGLSPDQRRYIFSHALYTLCYIAKCKYSLDADDAETSDEVRFLREGGDGFAR
jgi:hypothetical protein